MKSRWPYNAAELFDNILAGLTVSFVAISLGAAFGLLSGRGAFAGIISAGIIAFVTALLGGTRVQCSGPTAPMTAVTSVVVAFAFGDMLRAAPGADPELFINVTLITTGALLIIAAVLRLGRYVRLVPRVVISGFMNGIAILIFVDQGRRLLGLGGAVPFGGGRALNLLVAGGTTALIVVVPALTTRVAPKVARHLPATLIAIVVTTAIVQLSALDVEMVSLRTTLTSVADFADILQRNVPRDLGALPWALVLRFAAQLAMLCYLDTLLTSLVVDKLTGEKTHRERELAAQGFGNTLVAFVGGIPGAQATIRSVLIVKEHGTLRLAGVAVGAFVLIEMVLFQNLLNLVPQAVFSGVLLKVGYDVFDWLPVTTYVRGTILGRAMGMRVSHAELLFIAGTTAVTVLWDLNIAVISFAVLFHVGRRRFVWEDLKSVTEAGAVHRED